MLSRTADHLFWMARYMERAGQAAQRLAAKPKHGGALQRAAGRGRTSGLERDDHEPRTDRVVDAVSVERRLCSPSDAEFVGASA